VAGNRPPQRAGPPGNRSCGAVGHRALQPCNLLTCPSVVRHGRAR
jgi:hypothetical protein